MKRKSITLIILALLIGVLTFCLAGCDGWGDDNVVHGGTTAEIFSLSELNVYLGKGVLLPGEDADKIILTLSLPYVFDDFYDNPKSYCGMIDNVIIEVDEHDLHIVTRLTGNYSNNEEIVLKEYLLGEGWTESNIGDKKVVKKIDDGVSARYIFVDHFYVYDVRVDFDNDKADFENIAEIENFIASFKRYNYY